MHTGERPQQSTKKRYLWVKHVIMIALEFRSKIKNNRIAIPAGFQSKLTSDPEKDVRVIVFIEDQDEIYDDLDFKQYAASDFLKGYSESDSVYDNSV